MDAIFIYMGILVLSVKGPLVSTPSNAWDKKDTRYLSCQIKDIELCGTQNRCVD